MILAEGGSAEAHDGENEATAVYPQDMLTQPGTWLRRVRMWYAQGRSWQPAGRRAAPHQPQQPARPAGPGNRPVA